MKFLIKLIAVTSIGLANAAQASLSDDLNRSFNRIGIATNITATDIYKGQEGSFAFGGSAFMRTKHDNIQPAWYQPPGWRVGDCDMDLWAGGFGFLNAQKFVDMARNIGTSSAAYLFSLALKQIQPQIMNQIEALQEMANKINQHNIDSCESAKYFVNSGIDVIRSSANKSCQTKGVMPGSNYHGDPIRAKDKCNEPETAKDLANEASEDPQLKEQTLVNKNIAWHAIINNPTLNSFDIETKYFLMTLTGTVVITQNPPEAGSNDAKVRAGANAQTETVYPSKLDSDTSALLDAVSKQSKIKLYTCKDNEHNKCLQIVEREIELNATSTIYGQVQELLHSIAQKVKDSKALTVAEKDFIAKTDFEIYKLIKIQTAFSRNAISTFVNEYTDIIAMDLLYQYLDKCITDVSQAFANNQLPEQYSTKFNNMMNTARHHLQSVRLLSSKKAMIRGEMRIRAQTMQHQLTANVSSQVMALNKILGSE